MKDVVHKSQRTLADQPITVVVLLFVVGSMMGLYAIEAAATLPDFWRASAQAGLRVVKSSLWWLDAGLLLLYGCVGFFGLKVADRSANVLLDRFGLGDKRL